MMNEIVINIVINRISDLPIIKQKIIDSNFQFPVYILEYENNYNVNFSSDYGEWELESAIVDCFPGYEFVQHPGSGRKEIRLEFARHQSEFATDGWGRRLENPLNETKFLVKKSAKSNDIQRFCPRITVLFNNEEVYYYSNIIQGINKNTDEKGYLLLNNFNTATKDSEKSEILQDRLYKSPIEAFNFAFHKIQNISEEDFKIFIDKKKKKIREVQRIPRKLVRDFIKFCNLNDLENIFNDLHNDVRFEQTIGWKTNFKSSGNKELLEYLQSQEQSLCKMDIKIRSSWNFKLPYIDIGIQNSNNEKLSGISYRRMNFTIVDNKITEIVLEE